MGDTAESAAGSAVRHVCAHDDWAQLWQHRERLLRIARRRVLCPADAEDVVSEALLRAASFGPERIDEAGSWLTCVVIRLCADLYRRDACERRTLRATAFGPTTVPSPEEGMCDQAAVAALRASLDALPDRQRAALALRVDGVDVASIATRLGLSYKAVESSLSRARGALRARVESAFS